jgi:polyhydroxyalkanoate synthesis regulator phasin
LKETYEITLSWHTPCKQSDEYYQLINDPDPMKITILSTLPSLLLSAVLFAQKPQRPPLPPELKETAEAIRKAVDAGEITHEEAKQKHEEMIREFKEKKAELGEGIEINKDPLLIEKETLQAVREGKITKEEARKKLDALRKDMADNGERKRPQRPQKPEISDEVKAQIDAVKDLEKALHAEIKEKVNELGKDATREQIKATVESFKESNKDRFEEIKEAHSAIRENIEANRPEKPQRPQLTEDLKAKVDALHAKRKEMHEAQKELHQNLKEASKEEREEMITAFKEANKAKHEEIKSQAKEVKEEIRSLVETEATRTSDL